MDVVVGVRDALTGKVSEHIINSFTERSKLKEQQFKPSMAHIKLFTLLFLGM